MKRQFIQKNPFQNHESQQEQRASSLQWTQTGIQPAKQLKGIIPPGRYFPGSQGKGLLSSWKTGTLQPSPAPPVVIRPALTLKDGPITEPPFINLQAFGVHSLGQLAPQQSGIIKSPFIGTPIQSGPQTEPPPVAPAPSVVEGQSDVYWPWGPRPSRQASGQLPYSALPEQPTAPSILAAETPARNRKKKCFPIWVRLFLSIMLLLLLAVGGVAGSYYYTLSAPISNITGQTVVRLKGDHNPHLMFESLDALQV